MKATAFLIFYAGVLISLAVRVATTPEDSKEEIPPPRPTFPLFALPSFPFSALNLPYFNQISQVRATKTEYMEVTRRQTVHPVCYTAYEPKSPCLPYDQNDFRYDDYQDLDFDSVHEAHESFDLNEVRIRATPSLEVVPTESARSPKYLEFKLRRQHQEPATSSRIEGSEFIPFRLPAQVQPSEYPTKTVLITKLEKYTDRRVTATLAAVNCLPADRNIPMCQTYPNPIREAPDRRIDNLEVQPAASLNETQSEPQANP